MMRWLLRFVLGVGVTLAAMLALSIRRDVPIETLRARYATADSSFIPVGDIVVHYRDRGEGPAVVLVHGSNASLHTWEPWIAGLRDRYRTITLDLPGHGLTGPWPPGTPHGYGPDDFVALLQDFTKAVGAERFTLVGNSMGGRVAWHFALAHPERVERLILVDAGSFTPSGPPPIGFRLLRNPMARLFSTWCTPRWLYARTLQASYADPAAITPELIDRYWELNRRPGNRAATAERFALPVTDPDTVRLPTIQTPTLILWGREDHLIPLELGERLHAAIPGAQLRVYDHVGHIPQEEAPARSLADVRAFLGATVPAR